MSLDSEYISRRLFPIIGAGLTLVICALGIFAQAEEQTPSDANTPCPTGYSKGYSGYSYYCYSDVVKKTVDSVPPVSNSCPSGYQLSYRGYSLYCDLIICTVRSGRQPLPSTAEGQCPAGYAKGYSGYSFYCNPVDILAPCTH